MGISLVKKVQRFCVLGSEVRDSHKPLKGPVWLIKKLLNIEHRTLNVQHRIRYSVNLRKGWTTCGASARAVRANLPLETCLPLEDCSDQYSANFRSRLRRDSLVLKLGKAKRHQYWTFDVGRSMFDVQYAHYSGLLKLHMRGSLFNLQPLNPEPLNPWTFEPLNLWTLNLWTSEPLNPWTVIDLAYLDMIGKY